MRSAQEIEEHYYREVGTFVDLVGQREISCAKIILIATKVDGLQPPENKWFQSILQRTKDHISYLQMPCGSQAPVIFLFDEVLTTSAKDVTKKWLRHLHMVVTAMVTRVRPLPKVAIPQSWINISTYDKVHRIIV